ncbi:AEC family transporter [bacterium]|nr:AEC family transporter [bacterium]MBP5202057.1 AEC family transporter [bacterium]
MNLVEIVLTINFPIFLGWFFKQLKLFPDNESAVLRKFVIKATVPFLIFRNLYNADTKEFSQMLPMITALCLTLVFSAIIVVLTRNLSSSDKKISNSFCVGSFVGNYSYLGWGVLSYFYGETGFTRGVFFSMFFWPAVLSTGFTIIWFLSRASSGKASKDKIIHALTSNAIPPVLSAFLAMAMNFYGIKLPEWLAKSIGSIANITIPAILFTVGLSLSVILKKGTVRPVILGTFFRTIFGIIVGAAVLSIVSFCFKDIDITTKKVILMESVMPSAALSPFFADFVDSDKEVVSGIVTFSTIFSLVTLPFWYFMIEKWGSLL